MTAQTPGGQAEDREAIQLAKRRLMRVCRWDGPTAEQALARAAAEQRAALVAVAMRVLAASPEDLAAGRVLGEGRRVEPRQPMGRNRPRSKPAPGLARGKRRPGKR